MSETLTLLSLNLRGLTNFQKRRTVITWCREKNADIVFLQETHSKRDTKAPSTLIRFQTKTELFAPDTAIVHTATPKTITENGAIRKRSPEWSDLKTMLFENESFSL